MFKKLLEAIELAEQKEFDENSYDYMLDESFFDDEIGEFLQESEEQGNAELIREARRLAKMAIGKFDKALKFAKGCDSVFDDSIAVSKGKGSVQILALGCQSLDSKPGEFEFKNAKEMDTFIDNQILPKMKKIVAELQAKTKHKVYLSGSEDNFRIMLSLSSLNESEGIERRDISYDFMNEEMDELEKLADSKGKKEEKCEEPEECEEEKDDKEDKKEDSKEKAKDKEKDEKDDEDEEDDDDEDKEKDEKEDDKDDEDEEDEDKDDKKDDVVSEGVVDGALGVLNLGQSIAKGKERSASHDDLDEVHEEIRKLKNEIRELKGLEADEEKAKSEDEKFEIKRKRRRLARKIADGLGLASSAIIMAKGISAVVSAIKSGQGLAGLKGLMGEDVVLYEGKRENLPPMSNDEIDDENDTDECFEELLEFCSEDI